MERHRACVAIHHLPQLFEAQVARSPDAVAVVFEDTTLTYADLDARANQLAHHLRARGVGPEVVVGLCIERSPEMIVGLLGILKAGGAYLPLDPAYPTERLAFMIEDADVPVARDTSGSCTTASHSTATTSSGSMPTLPISNVIQRTAPANNLAPQNTAYVIYTSGSTGIPKGVAVTHQGLRNFLSAMKERLHLIHMIGLWL